MEELTGPNYQIKLTIKEGRNFENVLYPSIIVASLNNHSLETDLVQPDSNPQYLMDLIWEAEKKALRIMRSGQTPLKIECYILNEEGNREKIGYILLSIRTAQIIPKNEEVEIRFNSHTLLGLKGDLKTNKPELLLSLVIEELPTCTSIRQINQDTSSYQTITPVLLEHEHLIQLGPIDSCHDLFLITIMAGIVNNLDILIKESLLNEQMDNVSFWCHILDNDIRLKPFNKSSERQWILNEKIVIRIRSSLTVLRNYFNIHPYLLIFLRFKDNKIAQSKLDVRPLIFTNCINEFVKKTQNCSTSLEQQCILLKEGETFSAHEPKASISIKFKVQYVDKKYEQSQFPRIPLNTVPSDILNTTNDQFKDNQPLNLINSESHRNVAEDYEKAIPKNYSEYNNMLHNNQFANLQDCVPQIEELTFANNCLENIEAFHCFCLNVYITAIKLFPTCPLIRNFEFRFHHPKAEITSTLHPKIPIMSGGKLSLNNIGCKLHFISSKDEIKDLLISFPPKVSICDDNVNAKIYVAQTVLEVQKLFNQHKFECQYEALLADADGTGIGTIDIIMNLEDQGPYYNDKSRNSGDNLGPPILDDSLVYKIVDELETWKEKQKELFKIELKNKEEHYLNLLGEEWRKKKESLEEKLASSVEQCKILANSLSNATEDLRMRRLKSHEKETRLLKITEDLKKKYEAKIKELRLSSEQMQSDFATKLVLFEECKTSYESEIDYLKRENEKLQEKVKNQDAQISEYEKESSPSEQVTSLLQEVKNLEEKLARAEEKKQYYKEQWMYAHSEVQKMKAEYNLLLEKQIQNSNKEFKNIEYENILSANSEALASDQMFLHRMQKKLETIGPKSARLISNTEPVFASLNSILSKPSNVQEKHEFTIQDEERDAKINMLTEKKESLLKTGSYLNDDPIIVKLTNEIKSLMFNTK